MELGKANLVSLLSFDNRITKTLLLGIDNLTFEYPCFLKIQLVDENGEKRIISALDIALENNALLSIDLIIKHIINF